MPVKTHEFTDWTDFQTNLFSQLFGKNQRRTDRFLFRGHAEAQWELKSTLDRAREAEIYGRQEYARELIKEFSELVKESDDENLYSDFDEDRFLALGQHHGLPTRLLDWTNSPFIAAWFAFASLEAQVTKERRIAIWALDRTCNHYWNKSVGVDILEVTRTANSRLRNQQGFFTVLSTPSNSLEQHVETIEKSRRQKKNPLIKMTIPASQRDEALSMLGYMGISARTIYADLTGIAGFAKYRAIESLKSSNEAPDEDEPGNEEPGTHSRAEPDLIG